VYSATLQIVFGIAMEGRAKQIHLIILWAKPGLGWVNKKFDLF
jgi:hypothetical protein